MAPEIGGTLRDVALRTAAQEPLHPLSVDDYLRMVEVGILDEDDKVELLEGSVIEMSPEGVPHHEVVARLVEHIVPAVAGGPLRARIGGPLELRPDSMPEPDIAVIDRPAGMPDRHPDGAHLLVEVSFSSLRKDLDRKARIYARAGVREYWVVDLHAKVVHVHLTPRSNGYSVVDDVAPPAELVPTHLPLPPLDLAALFAG
jgi:Uma2 family endonuclease